jgi:hypothetical protein
VYRKLILLVISLIVISFFSTFGVAKKNNTNASSNAQILPIDPPEAPVLDGILDDSIWERAVPIGPLKMVEPDEGEIPSENTEIRIAATEDAIYFGIQCYESQPDSITSFTMQRDARLRGEDHIKIVLDTFGNGRTGYVFAVNPNGARYDGLINREGEGENSNWDGIWEAKTNRNETGWTVEIYIPIRTLRFRKGLKTWGFNVERRIQRNLETNRWASPIRNYKVTHISQGGELQGIPAFKQGLGLTIRPYSQFNRTHEVSLGDPTYEFRPGLDVLKNFGGNVTGLVSVNTDFAETEVDTRRVNLTRFPTFFPEKRTFFLEGADIFDFGLGMGFHHQRDIVPFFSRRIGLIEGEVIPLAFSLKATGSVGRFNFGVLDTITRSVEGLAPSTNLFAARGFQNILEESKVGFLVTAGDPQGRENSWLAGMDFVFKTTRFQGDKNLLFGVWGLVNQREDLGGDRTAFGVQLDYPNDIWEISLNYKRIGENFDPSMGFVPWKGIQKVNLNLNFKPRPKWTWLRQMWNELFLQGVWDLDGKLYQWRIFTAPINWRLESGDRIEFNIVPYMERLPESFEISPGVIVAADTYHWTRYRIEYQASSKRKITGKFSWWWGTMFNGNMNQWQTEVTWRPSHKVNISLQGEIARGKFPTGTSDIKLVQSRFDVYFSPNLQVLSYLQYDNLTKSLGMNTRLRWTYRSLLDIFIVYNRNWLDTSGRFLSDLNQFFIKIQYSFRR